MDHIIVHSTGQTFFRDKLLSTLGDCWCVSCGDASKILGSHFVRPRTFPGHQLGFGGGLNKEFRAYP